MTACIRVVFLSFEDAEGMGAHFQTHLAQVKLPWSPFWRLSLARFPCLYSPLCPFISLTLVSWFVATRESSSAAAAGGSCLLGSVHSCQMLVSGYVSACLFSISAEHQTGGTIPVWAEDAGLFLLLLAKEWPACICLPQWGWLWELQ